MPLLPACCANRRDGCDRTLLPALHRAVSDWLAHNCVRQALEAASGDPALSTTERGSLATALRAVALFVAKVPVPAVADGEVAPRRNVVLFLKSSLSRPSHGALHLPFNGVTATVVQVVQLAAELLGHSSARLHLETQAGKLVRHCLLHVRLLAVVQRPHVSCVCVSVRHDGGAGVDGRARRLDHRCHLPRVCVEFIRGRGS
jgi:hypothetical protein